MLASNKELSMLSVLSNVRLFLYRHPVSMHKSFEGLSAKVEEEFLGELFSGAYFIFLNRIGDCMKVLYWDGDGFAIWYKRLEKGKFSGKNYRKNTLSRREFFMLLEGVTPQKMQARYSIS
jgi:transposase